MQVGCLKKTGAMWSIRNLNKGAARTAHASDGHLAQLAFDPAPRQSKACPRLQPTTHGGATSASPDAPVQLVTPLICGSNLVFGSGRPHVARRRDIWSVCPRACASVSARTSQTVEPLSTATKTPAQYLRIPSRNLAGDGRQTKLTRALPRPQDFQCILLRLRAEQSSDNVDA